VSLYLQKLSEQAPAIDISVIEKKYSGKRISEMTGAELNTETARCTIAIHAVTGWALPGDIAYIQALNEQFSEKLKEDFYMLNFSEIKYAFRRNGIGVKDWGKNMNLELICGVLGEYCAHRENQSMEEERTKGFEQRIYTAEELLNIQRWDIEAFYQRCLKGVIPPAELPEYFKEVLVTDGFISQDSNDLHAFFAWMINNGRKNIYLKA